jgi:hypothetical protein
MSMSPEGAKIAANDGAASPSAPARQLTGASGCSPPVIASWSARSGFRMKIAESATVVFAAATMRTACQLPVYPFSTSASGTSRAVPYVAPEWLTYGCA